LSHYVAVAALAALVGVGYADKNELPAGDVGPALRRDILFFRNPDAWWSLRSPARRCWRRVRGER
jgi:hypothetical protein